MDDLKRVALFFKPTDEVDEAIKLKKLHDYVDANGLIPTLTLRSESELLGSTENYEILITADTVMLPIAGIEIIRV